MGGFFEFGFGQFKFTPLVGVLIEIDEIGVPVCGLSEKEANEVNGLVELLAVFCFDRQSSGTGALPVE